jgi:zinc transporter ZupT
MREAGFGPVRQFWRRVATSAPRPIGALIAFAAAERPAAFFFRLRGGAMLALVVWAILPSAYSSAAGLGPSAGIAAGAALMLGLGVALGV